MVYVNREACKGCGICIALCPVDVLAFSGALNQRGVAYPEVVAAERCTGCQNCVVYCPDFAVVVTGKPATEPDAREVRVDSACR